MHEEQKQINQLKEVKHKIQKLNRHKKQIQRKLKDLNCKIDLTHSTLIFALYPPNK